MGNMSSREFVDTITRDLLGSRVFVFTPKGEVKTKPLERSSKISSLCLDALVFHLQIKNLPKGATVVDYAYLIHTEIGNKMVAAKVFEFAFYHLSIRTTTGEDVKDALLLENCR